MLRDDIIAQIEECGCFKETEYPEKNLIGKTFSVLSDPVTLIINKVSVGPVVTLDTVGEAIHIWINPKYVGFDFDEAVLAVVVSFEEVDSFEVVD